MGLDTVNRLAFAFAIVHSNSCSAAVHKNFIYNDVLIFHGHRDISFLNILFDYKGIDNIDDNCPLFLFSSTTLFTDTSSLIDTFLLIL